MSAKQRRKEAHMAVTVPAECIGRLNYEGHVSCPFSRTEFVKPSKVDHYRCSHCKPLQREFSRLYEHDFGRYRTLTDEQAAWIGELIATKD